jgi:sec-independent protein translocase protein TatA
MSLSGFFTKRTIVVIITREISINKGFSRLQTNYHRGIVFEGVFILFGLIGNFGPWELGLILLIVLIVVGPGKLPKVGESMGKALQSFRKAKNEEYDELEEKDKK